MAKFLTSFGDDNKGTEGWFPTPEQVLKKTVEEMRAAGLSARKGEYIRDLADKFHSKQVDPTKFDSMTDTEISKELCSIKGIGQVK
jgi:DNA-3-methyladenine glycosylase II